MSEDKIKLKIQDTAPNFVAKVQNSDGSLEEIELYKLLETQKVLLVFYPGDNTPGCTAQLCGIRDVYSDYQKYNVKVLGVNPANGESHLKFIEKFNYQFGIIIDEDKTIREKYGAIGQFFKAVITKRGVFLINQDKTIDYIFWGQQDNQKIFDLLESQK
jgi:peroxiredoxin Q/BCP